MPNEHLVLLVQLLAWIHCSQSVYPGPSELPWQTLPLQERDQVLLQPSQLRVGELGVLECLLNSRGHTEANPIQNDHRDLQRLLLWVKCRDQDLLLQQKELPVEFLVCLDHLQRGVSESLSHKEPGRGVRGDVFRVIQGDSVMYVNL